MSITKKEYEDVMPMIRGLPISEDLYSRIAAELKPKRKNKKRAPFYEAVAEHFLTNDIITVDDMKAMPAYPEGEDRGCRKRAVNKAAKEQGFQVDKRGKFTWFKVKDNTEAHDAIFAEMKVDQTYQESKMREWCEKHKTDFDATVDVMRERTDVIVSQHHVTKNLTFKVIP